MYLKTVEIFGYKSFAQRTRIELEPGVVGIIGPNGCGKSNVMEAIRWCLGEMSWKSLRADSMIDVIFAGTAKRPALSMTEVTLTFDNSQSQLPIQFSEVTVSRRIFRSGESEYYLNKTQCRLRDIREMFLDTGLGGDGYAIIDQGGVDFVLSSKPDDRRSLFEEAAGVAKYKAKREEALRKLERVEADMARLQDSVALIADQVKKLDSDARKAKLYQKYKEELVGLETGHVLEQLGAIEAELASLAEASRPIEERLGQGKASLSAEGANLAAIDLERGAQRNEVIACNQKVSDSKSQLGRLEERIAQARQGLADIAARRTDCSAELDGARERLGKIDPEIDAAGANLRQAQERLTAAKQEAEGWSGRVAEAERAAASAQAALQQARAALSQNAETLRDLRRELSSHESAWTRHEGAVRTSLRNLEKDMQKAAAAEGEIAQAEAAWQAAGAESAAARELAAAEEARLAELQAQAASLGEDALRLRAELSETRARAESLEAQGEADPYWTGAQAVVAAQLPGVVGTVRQLLRAPEGVRASLEDALGERLYAVVCEDSGAARAAVDFLEASGKGRARFLVLSSLPPSGERAYPEEAKPLLRAVEFEPRFEGAVQFLLAESYTLGKCLFSDHWVCGGSAPREGQPLGLSDIAELRDRAVRLESAQGGVVEQRARVSEQAVLSEAQVRLASAARQEAAVREQSLAAQLAHKRQALELCRAEIEVDTEDAGRTLADMALVKESLLQSRSLIALAEGEEGELRSRESAAASAISAAAQELSRVQGSQELLEDRVRSAQRESDLFGADAARLASERERLAEAVARRERELRDLDQREAEANAREAEAVQGSASLSAELQGLEQAALTAFSRLHELDRAYAEKEDAIRTLKASCDAAQQELHEKEVQASSLRSRQEMLRTRLWDDWQLTIEEARKGWSGQPVDASRIESLRKRVASLGNINMAAPEEYEALSAKRDHLAAQIEDLNRAKEDLKSAIQKINSSTRENFRQTFIEVREQFRRLYGVLFEGGEADLVLTDPENILETGIEIVAQPPGKRLQSISLLSGGEKTLTAIALLFAFFMVKPSPFCMLDEADAALDESNVERFVSILREFQSRTQFLIVSHNKRTMEAADVIYGVTMEEMGVSQIISVDFRKKERSKAPPKPAETLSAPERPSAHEDSSGGTAVAVAPAPVVAEPVVEAVAEPVIEAVAEPAADPVVEPVVEAASDPVVEPAHEPVADPVSDPEPAPEAVSEPVPEAAQDPSAGTASEISPEEGELRAPAPGIEDVKPPTGPESSN